MTYLLVAVLLKYWLYGDVIRVLDDDSIISICGGKIVFSALYKLLFIEVGWECL